MNLKRSTLLVFASLAMLACQTDATLKADEKSKMVDVLTQMYLIQGYESNTRKVLNSNRPFTPLNRERVLASFEVSPEQYQDWFNRLKANEDDMNWVYTQVASRLDSLAKSLKDAPPKFYELPLDIKAALSSNADSTE